jgi:hypothetical protein
MKIKFHHVLAPFIFGLATVACEQKESEEINPAMSADQTSNATAAGVIFEELFEGSNPLTQSLIMDNATGTSHARTYVSSPVFQGSKVARFELRDSDPEFGGGTRTDFAFKTASGKDRWYSFAMYFPANTWGRDSHAEILAQWHAFPDAHLGEGWRTPATKLLVHEGRLRFDVGYSSQKVNTGVDAEKKYDLGAVPHDNWQEFVVHIVHSYGSDGLVEVWQNGKKIVEHKGGNSYNDDRLPYLKLGIYKWGWNGTKTTDVNKRVLYMDNVRVGNETASFSSMSSATTSTTPVESQPEPVSSTPVSSTTTTGSLTRELWTNVQGWKVSHIPLNTTPKSVNQITSFETPTNFADNYGQRIRGYVTAPTTGNYTFWIAADDHAELWLSTSENPSKKVKIAQSTGYTAPRQWDKYSSQRSVSIKLEAGKRYYIEALHKEGGGGDNLAVGWRLPSGAYERPIAGNRLSPFSL